MTMDCHLGNQIFEAGRKKLDLLDIESVNQAFEMLAKSSIPNCIKIDDIWLLKFSLFDLGFVLTTEADPTISVGICPVRKCRFVIGHGDTCPNHYDIQFGNRTLVTYAGTENGEPRAGTSHDASAAAEVVNSQSSNSSDPSQLPAVGSGKIGLFVGGRIKSADIQRVMSAVEQERMLEFRWTPTAAKLDIFDSIGNNPFHSQEMGVIVTRDRQPGTSLTISATNGNGLVHLCSNRKAPCYRIGIFEHQCYREWYCSLHQSQASRREIMRDPIPHGTMVQIFGILYERETGKAMREKTDETWTTALRYLYKRGRDGASFRLDPETCVFLRLTHDFHLRMTLSKVARRKYTCMAAFCFEPSPMITTNPSSRNDLQPYFCEQHRGCTMDSDKIKTGLLYEEGRGTHMNYR